MRLEKRTEMSAKRGKASLCVDENQKIPYTEYKRPLMRPKLQRLFYLYTILIRRHAKGLVGGIFSASVCVQK